MVSRHGEGTNTRFIFHLWDSFYGEFNPVIVIDDPEVRRPGIARAIFSKLEFHDEGDTPSCDRSFDYGWNFIFGTPEEGEAQ